MFFNIKDQEKIMKTWAPMINAQNDIKDDTIKMSTAIVLENAQQLVDQRFKSNNSRGLITEAMAGITTAGAMGPYGQTGSLAGTAADGTTGDARVPSVVIPMIRRIYPQLIAHKLVGVQPMQGPIGMAFAFRAKYGRNTSGQQGNNPYVNDEIGYLNVHNDHTGQPQNEKKFAYEDSPNGLNGGANVGRDSLPSSNYPSGGFPFGDQGQVDLSDKYVSGGISDIGPDPQQAAVWDSFFGKGSYMGVLRNNGRMIGDGADTSDAENWAIGSTMPEAGFEFLKATVTAKTRKLGVQITRETEEDMKAMQGMNAQNEVSDIISYEIAQEIDRQLLGEIVQAAIRAGNASTWSPAQADGRNQRERTDALYTTILQKSAQIAVQSRRGAANWCVASPAAAALLEAHIYNPLGVAGGLGNAKAFGNSIDNNIGVTEIGSLRNGTIKLYRDTLAGGDYILLGYKGNTIYDAGVIYLPYIPLELMHGVDPFTFNPLTAARTRYRSYHKLIPEPGQFYSFLALPDLTTAQVDGTKLYVQP